MKKKITLDWKGFQVSIKETRLFLKAKNFREGFDGDVDG